MSVQLPLDLGGAGRRRKIQPSPSPDRRIPTFWIRRLRILREMATGAEQVVRDVELRRGLNVIWAPSSNVVAENTLYGDGVVGHTAGKTTFCRLLRYVLGESSFSPEATRNRIREAFPNGWVAAEVVVGDEDWVVARSLGVGSRSFCARASSLDDVADVDTRLDYGQFLDAIAAAAMTGLQIVRFPGRDAPLKWEHLLAWLSRDQECRFAAFLDWRDPKSDAASPALVTDDRHFLTRSVLRLVSDPEHAEQQRNARIVTEKHVAEKEAPLLADRARTIRARVASALGLQPPSPEWDFFANEARGELRRRCEALAERDRALQQADDRRELQEVRDRAVAAEAVTRRELRVAEDRRDAARAALQQADGSGMDALVAASLQPFPDYCNQSMRRAREAGCPLATTRPKDLQAYRSERSAAVELEALRREVRFAEGEVQARQLEVDAAHADLECARRASLAGATRFAERREELLTEQAELAQIGRLVDEADAAHHRAMTQVDTITRLTHNIVESRARQDQLRSDIEAAIRAFSARFDMVVRAFLGEATEGVVDTAGRSLQLSIMANGERDSAAIATVKVLSFDLAALLASIEGCGFFPRFLIHDGPREADLASDIYERVFLLARQMEGPAQAAEEPPFQYILTTTTPPPAAFQQAPWLRLTLAATPAEARLLRRDL